MWREVEITIRKFERSDISRKIEWINNSKNNQFLHYDIPLSTEKTERWFDSHTGEATRYDAVIEADGVPVGIIGLLNIDYKSSKAEYYITLGETFFRGKGVAKQASKLILKYGFEELELNRIYLFTEIGNISAQKLFEKVGFIREGLLRQDVFSHGEYADRYAYGYLKKDWEKISHNDDNSKSGRI